DGDDLFDVLRRQHSRSRGDVAEEGDVADRAAVDDRAGARLERDLDGAGLARVAPQVALVLQGGEVGVNRRGRGQADRLADLTHARRVALLPGLRVDELEHLALTRGEP